MSLQPGWWRTPSHVRKVESARIAKLEAEEKERKRRMARILALVFAAVVALAAFFCVGCSTPGRIKASAISDAVAAVCSRHDAYVKADVTLDDPHSADYGKRETWLRTSRLLRETVQEAEAQK